ncbi:MAG: hypothetical protein PHW04_00385 [Candidatus Wallbacteria bacterium]|nr:hypothetical protein [Candidatus Wallbacteria bacterium]
MKLYGLFLILALAGMTIVPAFAGSSFVGVAQVTVCAEKNGTLPEITVQKCTDKLYATQSEAAAAAAELINAVTQKARQQARSIWGVSTQVTDNQIRISEKNTFARQAPEIKGRETLYYRGIVAQAFMFNFNGDSKVEFYSEVTPAFASYDEAFKTAQAQAKHCMDTSKACIAQKYNVLVDQIEMISVTFDVNLTTRNEANYVPHFRGMVVDGLSFDYQGERKFVQIAGVTEVFDNYNDAWNAARGMAKSNLDRAKAEVSAQYSVTVEKIEFLSVVFDVQLM